MHAQLRNQAVLDWHFDQQVAPGMVAVGTLHWMLWFHHPCMCMAYRNLILLALESPIPQYVCYMYSYYNISAWAARVIHYFTVCIILYTHGGVCPKFPVSAPTGDWRNFGDCLRKVGVPIVGITVIFRLSI